MTYNHAAAVSADVTVDTEVDNAAQQAHKSAAKRETILKDTWVFDFLMMDEVHEMRNSKTVTSRILQRIARKALTGIGATATPFWNSPPDTVGSARSLGHGKVPLFSANDTATGEAGHSVTLLETDWEQAKRDRSGFEGKAQKKRQTLREEAGESEAQAKVLERPKS
jgi:hypothetical protein